MNETVDTPLDRRRAAILRTIEELDREIRCLRVIQILATIALIAAAVFVPLFLLKGQFR